MFFKKKEYLNLSHIVNFLNFLKKFAAKSIKIAWIYEVCAKISSFSLAFWVKIFSIFAYSFCQPNLGAKVFPPPPRQIYNEQLYRQRRNLALARHYTNAHCPCLCWWDNQALMKGSQEKRCCRYWQKHADFLAHRRETARHFFGS